jgi:hypothetical protein
MTREGLAAKRKGSKLAERQASQSHFTELCRMLGWPGPTDEDTEGHTLVFEKGARQDRRPCLYEVAATEAAAVALGCPGTAPLFATELPETPQATLVPTARLLGLHDRLDVPAGAIGSRPHPASTRTAGVISITSET